MTNKVYIDGFIGEVYDYWADELKNTSNSNLVKTLAEMNGDLEIHINSKGGDAFEGMALLGTLKNYDKGEKTLVVDGFCASAATLPLFAVDHVKAHETSMFCFHKSATFAMGHASDLRKSADDLERIDDVVMDLYLSKFKGSKEELESLLDEDRLMSAKEAHELGFIDELITNEEEPEKEEPQPKATMSFLDGFKLAQDHVDKEHDKLENSFLAKFKKVE